MTERRWTGSPEFPIDNDAPTSVYKGDPAAPVAVPAGQSLISDSTIEHLPMACGNRYCAQHRDIWRHYEDHIAARPRSEVHKIVDLSQEDAEFYAPAPLLRTVPRHLWRCIGANTDTCKDYRCPVHGSGDVLRCICGTELELYCPKCEATRTGLPPTAPEGRTND